MAVSSSRGRTTEVLMSRKWKESRETSPERTKVWIEPSSSKVTTQKKVPVVYYLCRNGQLEQPHFMEVPLSSPEGLYLRDVINRLNFLRGKGMATMYSWSSKRGYKNGFVWHDLSESDFIYPASGKEYVLKGSELLDGGSLISKSNDSSFSSSFRKPPPETRPSGDDSDFPATVTRRRNQSWSAIDLHEYQVYKAESTGESSAAADASTQTDDKRRRRRPIREIEEEEREDEEEKQTSRELSSEEISITPPPSDSSPETLETLMKADGRLVLCPPGEISNDRTADNHPSGRHKASTVLMQLISCGSMSFKDCGATSAVKDPRFSLISHYKARLPRGGGGKDQVGKGAEEGAVENPRFEVGVIGRGGNNNNSMMMEDKEYFSGSLIETKKDEFAVLKRSNSYNADRTSHLELTEKGTEGMKAKCIPRKPKTPTTN